MKYILTLIIAVSTLFSTVFMLNKPTDAAEEISVNPDKVYEMRIYTTHDGKLDALHQRFIDHTLGFFEKHGMTNIAYWIPENPELKENTLIYIVSHESTEAAEASWDAFRNDPEWQKAYEESHADGVIVSNIESIFMTTTPYSPMK